MFSTDERTHSFSIVLALLTFIAVLLGDHSFPILFRVPLLYPVISRHNKIFQQHTVDPVEGQDLKHLEKGPAMFILSKFSFLILFWSSTKICAGNLFFPLFVSIQLSRKFWWMPKEVPRFCDWVRCCSWSVSFHGYTTCSMTFWETGVRCLCDWHVLISLPVAESVWSELLLLLGPAVSSGN